MTELDWYPIIFEQDVLVVTKLNLWVSLESEFPEQSNCSISTDY